MAPICINSRLFSLVWEIAAYVILDVDPMRFPKKYTHDI